MTVPYLLPHVHILIRRTIPSRTCGNGECFLDLAESVLERNNFPPLERVKSTRCLFPLESTLSKNKVRVTPDAALMIERRDDTVEISVDINLEYR